MKSLLTRSVVFGSLLLSLALSSCVDPYYGYGGPGYGGPGYGGPGYGRSPATGAVAGGLLGAAAGGIIGNQSRRGLEGAAIGGLLGALAGSAIQNSRQRTYYNSGYDGGGNCNRGYNQRSYYNNQGGYYGNQGYYNSQPSYPPPSYGYGQPSSYDPYAWQ